MVFFKEWGLTKVPIKSKFAERGQCAAAFLSLLGFGGDFEGRVRGVLVR